MSSIFYNYTGNAMLNNALMTIETLGNLKNVSEVTPNFLLDLYKSQDVKEINKRLKSYTMLFSLNNPLVNPAKKQDAAGEKTYNNLLLSIMQNFENQGSKICEMSGLRFEKTFEDFYKAEIEVQKKAVKLKKLDIKEEKKVIGNLDNTDFSLNRSWFPLIGGLGSDAQALPQAKFSIQIHPICIAIMQFLPLAALLYKGGVLLIDSSNFDFSRAFVSNNVKELKKRIELAKSNESIENVRDYSKGSYLLIALKILEDKKLEEEYSDLNLWSFSNSGTGASCEIDRVPNVLIQKLIKLRKVSSIKNEVDNILRKNESAFSFLESLENNIEWWLLYPNKFGSGKKAVDYEGVSVKFLETYFTVIGSPQKIEYAKYLAYLISKYKSKTFEKYLSDTSAWNEKDYRMDLYAVLSEATKNGEWDLYHHLEILDNINQTPIKNNFYNIHKITHFYYQKETYRNQLPDLKNNNSASKSICEWLISLIQQDEKSSSIVKDLVNNQNYNGVIYNEMLIRLYNLIEIEDVLFALYDESLKSLRFGINELLHIFFLQPNQPTIELKELHKPKDWALDAPTKEWIKQVKAFSNDYIKYYYDKYENKETGTKPISKFKNQIATIPTDTPQYLRWFDEALENTNEFLKANDVTLTEKWSDALHYNGQGEFSPSLSRFLFKFFAMKQYLKSITEKVIS
ncbi:MAG TPA: hypothetical protein PKD32_12655 [Saprospiraceae bacterium]|nr:hypothetical protein [Saprospiraceae bacterium]